MMCIEKYGHVASVQGRGALTAPTVRGTSVPARGAGSETRPDRTADAAAGGRQAISIARRDPTGVCASSPLEHG